MSAVAPPETDFEVTIRPPRRLGIDVRELWRERELLLRFAERNVKIRYKQSLAGPGWALFQPLLGMIIFTVIFGEVAGLSSGGMDYAVFSYVALVPWTYFATSMASGASSFVDNQSILTKVYFPRLYLPFSYAFSGLVDLGIALGLAIPLALALGEVPNERLLLLPFAIGIAFLTATGLSSFLAALMAKYRDVRVVVPFFVQAGLYVSPVAYSTTLVPDEWRLVYAINPMVSAIEMFRSAFSDGSALSVGMVLVSTAVAVLLFVGGTTFSRRTESTVVDVL